MFRGPHFIISTMQAGITPIFKVFGMTRWGSRLTRPQHKWVRVLVEYRLKRSVVHVEWNSNLFPTKFIHTFEIYQIIIFFLSLQDVALGPLPPDGTLIMTEIPCQLPSDLVPLNVMMTSTILVGKLSLMTS